MSASIVVGDVVLVTGRNLECSAKTGVVKLIGAQITHSSDGPLLGVEFCEDFEGGSNLNGHILLNRGYYLTSKQIVKMFPLSYVINNQTKPKKTTLKRSEPVFIIEEDP